MISIITATFNAAATVADCLQSVASQTHSAEHIVIDGVSTDATLEVVRRNSPHARIISEPDHGIYDAMNKGIAAAKGTVIGILNADDFYASNRVLEKVAKVFDDPSVDACYGDLLYVAETAAALPVGQKTEAFRTIRYWKSGACAPNKFYWGWMPPHPTFFVRRHVYERYGLFNLALGSAADYELMLRFLLKENVAAAYIPEVLVKMRTGGASNANMGNRIKANIKDRKAWEVNGLRPYPWTLFLKPVRKIPQWFNHALHFE